MYKGPMRCEIVIKKEDRELFFEEARGRKICFAVTLDCMHSGRGSEFGTAEAKCTSRCFFHIARFVLVNFVLIPNKI